MASTLSGPTTVTAADLHDAAASLVVIGNVTSGSTNAAVLDVQAAAPSTLQERFLVVTGDADLNFISGGITDVGSSSQVIIAGAQARVSVASDTSENSGFSGFGQNSGTFGLSDHASITTSASVDFLNSGSLDIDGGAALSIGGTLINTGFISIFTVGGEGIIPGGSDDTTIVTAAGLRNTGGIWLGFFPNDPHQAILNITGAAPSTWTGEASVLDNALLEFGSGGIESIASGASLAVRGAARVALAEDLSSNSALTGLVSNAGTLALDSVVLSLVPSTFTNSGQVFIDDAGGDSAISFGTVSNTGTLTIGDTFRGNKSNVTASALNNNGYVYEFGNGEYAGTISGGIFTVNGPAVNGGVIELVEPAILQLVGAVTGSGSIYLGGTLSTVEFSSSVAAGQTIVIGPGSLGSGNLKLDDPAEFAGTVSGLTAYNGAGLPPSEIDLPTVPGTDVTGGSLNTSTDIMSIEAAGVGPIAIQLTGTYAPGTQVNWMADASGTGTDIFLISNIACFCRGTRILTPGGEVAVEELAIGDRVVTLSGVIRPVKWIGRRAYDARFIAGKPGVRPVRIVAGALGSGLPTRDLFVSPEHAMFIDGVLVAAYLLVNGTTIAQAARVENLEYFHIELETHDIILADGAPSESYVECDNRAMFHNAADFAARYPRDRPKAARFCAPRLADDAAELDAIRARLAAGRRQAA